ncbi:hypothetical protein TrLO_g2760 [Triparma laevis f. longispina]|uniref:Uncharacterized protein n=1 Tax=Triparma laevis f. longispina TaxID=1714387 RepID=A0A9W7FUN5_9STRA|nr:hypothetical protein TrLO_g2760 [Triparma laevis f. longispina]
MPLSTKITLLLLLSLSTLISSEDVVDDSCLDDYSSSECSKIFSTSSLCSCSYAQTCDTTGLHPLLTNWSFCPSSGFGLFVSVIGAF